MSRRRSSTGVGILFVVLLASASGVVALLVKKVAREKERATQSETAKRSAESERGTLEMRLREAASGLDRAESQRAHREAVVEGELGRLRRELSAATKSRDALDARYRSAAGERDRAVDDLLTARREIEALRNDLASARAEQRRAAGAAEAAARRAEEASGRLAVLEKSLRALLRPLLADLRSSDGSLRVRAHEALSAYAGRDLAFRPNGTPEEIDADVKAIERMLLGP